MAEDSSKSAKFPPISGDLRNFGGFWGTWKPVLGVFVRVGREQGAQSRGSRGPGALGVLGSYSLVEEECSCFVSALNFSD